MTTSRSQPAGSKGGRRRAAKGEGDLLRKEILDAAEILLVKVGSEDLVSIRAIADAVGVTPPSIYRHFTDKSDLVHQVCERRFKDLNDAFEASGEAVSDPMERLLGLGKAYGQFALRHPEHYRVLMMTSSSGRPSAEGMDDESEGAKAFRYLVDAVVECARAGRIVTDDPTTTAVMLWSGLHGLVSLLITAPTFPWPRDAESLIQEVLETQTRALEA